MNKPIEVNMTRPASDIRTRKVKRFFKEFGFGYFLLAPVVLYIIIFQFYPLFETIRLSFYDYSLVKGKAASFVGFGNYMTLLSEDRNFWSILPNSIVWVFGQTILQFLIAIPAALILNLKLRSRGLWRGLMMVPWVSPVVIVGIIWKWIYDGQYGLANHYLKILHIIQENIVWLGDDFWVWPVLLLTAAWKGFPYITLMLLSGLQGISKDMLEASHVDGASTWQRFRFIILPLLRPIMFVTGLVSIVASWTKFEMIWVLTNGGPGFETSILPTYLYTQSFKYFNLGMGATVGTLSMVLIVIIVLIYKKIFDKEIY